MPGRHPIGERKENQLVHPLDRPCLAVVAGWMHKFGREPVKQLRMRRRITLKTKIIWCPHQSLTEVMLPNPIHEHSRCKRITLVRNPGGELQSTGCCLRSL